MKKLAIAVLVLCIAGSVVGSIARGQGFQFGGTSTSSSSSSSSSSQWLDAGVPNDGGPPTINYPGVAQAWGFTVDGGTIASQGVAITLMSGKAAGSSVATVIDTTTTYTNGTLLAIRTNGTDKLIISSNGDVTQQIAGTGFVTQDGTYLINDTLRLGNGSTAGRIFGALNPADGSASITLDTNQNYTTVGSQLVGFLNNGTKVSNVDKDGAITLNMVGGTRPTCAVGIRGKLWFTQSASLTADVISVCLKNIADVYTWTDL